MTINSSRPDFFISHGQWKGQTLYDLYSKAETPFEWHEELFEYAKKNNITLFSTPFDETAVDLLEKIKTPAYKVASFELTDLPLISYIAKKKKPILISTGMASEKEIKQALSTIKKNGSKDILLFHCISEYPAKLENSNLKMIRILKKTFKGVLVGLSDHTIGTTAAIIATTLGVSAIEKHFTINKKLKSEDAAFSIEPEELNELSKTIAEVHQSLKNSKWRRTPGEKKNKIFRRSIYYSKDLKKGEILNKNNIRRIRPGYGMNPKNYFSILGKKIVKNVKTGDRVKLNHINKKK